MTAEQINEVDIIRTARSNDAFRRVVLTGEKEQVVVMTIPVGGDIGSEVHPSTDQVLVFVDGEGVAELDGVSSPVRPNDLVFVQAGTRHNFTNTGAGPMRLITIYAPPEHQPGTIHPTKADAEADEGH